MKVVSIALTTACLLLGVVGSARSAEQDDFATLERQFRELPMEARRLTGPLFWLHGDETREQLEAEIAKIAEGGNGCFTAESRPHKDWLGPGWWRDLGICLEAAKKHNLQMWIFDEKWWPSQEIGGKVPPRYAVKRLEAIATDVEGPREFEADGYGGARYVGAVAGRMAADGKIEGDTLVDLAPSIHDGKLRWKVPAGKWKVMKFNHVQGQPLAQTGHLSVDGASKDCVDWYINTVYQPHFDHFGAEFGKTIRGFFYDEPETRGDWGTELNSVLAERKVDWKKAYVAHKFQLAGEEQVAAKFQYLDAFAETWGRTLYGGIARWCHEHHVKSIGHFMEHGGLYHNKDFCAGDMTRLQRYSDMGALDAVFKQFVMGQKSIGKMQWHDEPVWQTPKLASSISHVFGKADDVTMVEIFGARGQDLTYREMKWWTDHMQVSGVNFLIPHSFNPRGPYDDDCPPYFYNGGFEPRWPLYRVFADYTSRLSLMLTGGRHVCPVAILFNGNLGQVGKMVPPEGISEALQDAQIDCDWLPMDVFEKEAVIARRPRFEPTGPDEVRRASETAAWHPTPHPIGAEVQLHGERYQILVVPPTEVITYATLSKLRDFYNRGGRVISYGFLPSKSATIGKTKADVTAICREIWNEMAGDCQKVRTDNEMGKCLLAMNSAGGRSHLLMAPIKGKLTGIPNCEEFVRPAMEVLEGDTYHWLHILHRRKAGRDIFLVTNQFEYQNEPDRPNKFRFLATVPGEPELWDPLRNEVTSLPYRRVDAEMVDLGHNEALPVGSRKKVIEKRVEFTLALEPLETVLLVFQPEKIARPPRIEFDTKPIREAVAIVREASTKGDSPIFADTKIGTVPAPTPDMKRKPVTLSPVKGADPFRGRVTIPADVDLAKCRVCLEMEELPDEAAAVTVNGQKAGGLIGRPLRLDITQHLKPGENSVLIEPLAPKAARLTFYAP